MTIKMCGGPHHGTIYEITSLPPHEYYFPIKEELSFIPKPYDIINPKPLKVSVYRHDYNIINDNLLYFYEGVRNH